MDALGVELEWGELVAQTVQRLHDLSVLNVLQILLLQQQKLHLLQTHLQHDSKPALNGRRVNALFLAV